MKTICLTYFIFPTPLLPYYYYYHYYHQYQYQYQYHHHLVAICSYPTINSCDYGPNSITSL